MNFNSIHDGGISNFVPYFVSGVGLLDLGNDAEPQFLCHLKVLRESDESILQIVFGVSPLIGLKEKRIR